MAGSSKVSAPAEAPATGMAGLKHWRHDLVAGLQVALLWTPFSLGVALASGAPAIAGLISAIVAGLLFPLLGGSHVTVSGPAAALAPVLLWGMLLLGGGDLAAGYPLVLVAIVFTGVLQLLLSALGAGRYASMLPATVVEAMLAAIGIMIILRQLPALAGAAARPAHSVLEALALLPGQLANGQPAVAAIGVISLAMMFAWPRRAGGAWRWVPPAIAVAGFGVVAAALLDVGPAWRIRMPEHVLDAITLPAFATAFGRPDLWLAMAIVVFTFTMIDGVESVASVKAVDKIDPYRRKSDANRTLRSMGVCNLVSGMVGGLTVIPNAVPSRANIDAGARTLWSNLFSGLFLLLFLLALPGLLARIPLAAIAGLLIYIGWRLCEPAQFVRMLSIGRDRFLVFASTVLAILLSDLLLGMLAGVAIELALLLYLLMPSLRYVLTGQLDARASLALLWANMSGLFRSPVIKQRTEQADGTTWQVLTMGSLVGFNLLQLERCLAQLPPRDGLRLRFTESARIIDHTAVEYLQHIEEEAAALGRPFAVEGTAHFLPFSAHPLAARMQTPQFAQEQTRRGERAERMAAVAARLKLGFSPAAVATINRHDFVYLRRGDRREEENVIHGPWAGGQIRLFDYSHTAAPDYHVAHRHTLMVFELPAAAALPDFVLTPGHYLERYLVHLRELDSAGLPPDHHCYGVPGEDTANVLHSALPAREIEALGPLYIELRRGRLLAFSPQRGLEDEPRIEAFAALAAAFAAQATRLAAPPPAAAGMLSLQRRAT
jgi:carbonic anhydrase